MAVAPEPIVGGTLIRVLVDGSAAAIEALAGLLAPGQASPIIQDEHGHWLTLYAAPGLRVPQAIAELESLLDIASGVIGLWANLPPLKVRSASYTDPATGKAAAILLNGLTVVARQQPEALAQTTEDGRHIGAALLDLGQAHAGAARALSLLASGGTAWWEVYILLEILRDNLGARPNHRTGSWSLLFQHLSERYGHSVNSLENLKQTANFHRHAQESAPKKPWRRPEAGQFVRQATRDWLTGLLVAQQ